MRVKINTDKKFEGEEVKMNMFEEATSIKSMMALGNMTQAKVAAVLGVSQPYVANKLRLLSYTEGEREKILEYGLSERHARTILRLKSATDRLLAIEKAHAMKMNVARCEASVDFMLDEQFRENPPKTINYAERLGHFERSLESSVLLLREAGIKARSFRDEDELGVYFRIYIG